MKRTSLLLALILPVTAALAAGDPADQAFVTQAAQGGIAEVELGKLASQKGSTAQVKSFGQKMVTDHEMANTKLKTIATRKGFTVPAETDAMHQAAAKKMAGLSGAMFDREYLASQVADHEKTIALLERQAQSGKDAELKTFASETLPVVQQHYDMVKKLHAGDMASHDKH
jgi:putative membrane protein